MTKKLTKDAFFGKAKNTTIGERIKQIRGKESRKLFCGKLNIGVSTLINYENDARVPDATLIGKICDTYNITADWLIFGKSGADYGVNSHSSQSITKAKDSIETSTDVAKIDPSSVKNWASSLRPINFKSLWDEYWNWQEARRGWLQVEIIERFPEFIKWLEQRHDPLRLPHLAALKEDELGEPTPMDEHEKRAWLETDKLMKQLKIYEEHAKQDLDELRSDDDDDDLDDVPVLGDFRHIKADVTNKT